MITRKKYETKTEKVIVDPSYQMYVERCEDNNVKPLTEEKWQRILVDGTFTLDFVRIQEMVGSKMSHMDEEESA